MCGCACRQILRSERVKEGGREGRRKRGKEGGRE